MESPELSTIRTEYLLRGLTEEDAGSDAFALLTTWLADAIAAGIGEPNAMAVATATPDGRPSVRTVLLKGLDERGLVFFTHYDSRKGRELAANPYAAATLLWHPMHRQVRVEGAVTRVDPAESDAYFASRPRGAQLGAVASEQSRPIADRSELDERLAWVEASADDDPVRRPDHWGGYRIALESIEFWHGRAGRLHDRLLFVRRGDAWERRRLQP